MPIRPFLTGRIEVIQRAYRHLPGACGPFRHTGRTHPPRAKTVSAIKAESLRRFYDNKNLFSTIGSAKMDNYTGLQRLLARLVHTVPVAVCR